MEREKQKQIDRVKERQDRIEYEEKMKLSEKEALDIIKSTIVEPKSKFVS